MRKFDTRVENQAGFNQYTLHRNIILFQNDTTDYMKKTSL